MKYFAIVWVLVALFTVVQPGSTRASENDQLVLIETLHQYLKEGNTEAILNLFTAPLLTQKEGLLENNPAYAQFLRETYANSTLDVNKIDRLNDSECTVDVQFNLVGENQKLQTRFVLNRQNGIWKIADEMILED